MIKHSGSARDPVDAPISKSSSSTPGMGWVIAGLVAICLAVAAAHSGGWLQDGVSHVAGSASSQG